MRFCGQLWSLSETEMCRRGLPCFCFRQVEEKRLKIMEGLDKSSAPTNVKKFAPAKRGMKKEPILRTNHSSEDCSKEARMCKYVCSNLNLQSPSLFMMRGGKGYRGRQLLGGTGSG